jgi:signal transduction histidine kinase
MSTIFGYFFDSEGLMPHGMCLQWRPDVFWLNLASDSVIALAYYSIPFALIYFAMHRRDLVFRPVFFLFGFFILACGATHIMGIWTLWHPDYAVDGLIKAVTALASIGTAIVLWPLMPQALTMPSPTQLAVVNRELSRQIEERRQAEVAVRRLNEDLEERVRRRTAELETANQRLQREIVERRRIEAELRDAKEQAERASHTKSDFLAKMSHELRTPLNAIIGFSEISMNQMYGEMGSPKYLEYARDIYLSGTHLLLLINDLLDIARIEAGRLELIEAVVDIRQEVEDSVRLLRRRAEESRLTLATSVTTDRPFLRADRRALKQILLNLLSNAIKYTPAGGCVSVVAEQDDTGDLIINVVDTGIGMSAQEIPRALEAFVQIGKSDVQEGTGLGLPIVKALVELHGGRLDIASAVGEGTTVTVRLPARRMVDDVRQVG